jgi:hypothetical protein
MVSSLRASARRARLAKIAPVALASAVALPPASQSIGGQYLASQRVYVVKP